MPRVHEAAVAISVVFVALNAGAAITFATGRGGNGLRWTFAGFFAGLALAGSTRLAFTLWWPRSALDELVPIAVGMAANLWLLGGFVLDARRRGGGGGGI